MTWKDDKNLGAWDFDKDPLWSDDKNNGAWDFEKQEDKFSINVGNKIATSADPTWDTAHDGVPVTPTNVPAGYWFSEPYSLSPDPDPPDPDPDPVVGDILIAYIANSPCQGAGSGLEIWAYEIVPSTKFYSEGALSDGYNLPIITDEWCCMFDFLPNGRLVLSNGSAIYLETSYQSGVFSLAATISINADTSFLKVSPDGTKIALGVGYNKALIIFDVLYSGEGDYTSISESSSFNVDYYDAVWWDNQYLLINSILSPGVWDESIVWVLNISTGNTFPAIGIFPGSSGGMCLDNYNNLITGIGYGDPTDYTGDVYAYKAATIQAIINGGSSISYSSGTFLCKSLSAGHMIVDHNDSLLVGGGDYLKTTYEGIPYPDVIGHVEKFPLLYDGDGDVSTGVLEKLYPDSCEDDSAAGPLCKIPEM